MLGRGQRSAGLRSASIVPETGAPPSVEKPPYIITPEYILRKYQGNPPSLVVHLHPTHFRFDQQDSTFPYKSPMGMFIEHLRKRTIPHDLLDYFTNGGVPFYEGCMIVQVHDHKSVAQAKEATTTSKPNDEADKSIHRLSAYLTPSPYAIRTKETLGLPSEKREATDPDGKENGGEDKDKEAMPAPSLPGEGQKSKTAPKARVFTTVLLPTAQSLQRDLTIKAATPRNANDGRNDVVPQTPAIPPTPSSAMPPPAKKLKTAERMELDATNIYAAEGEILVATTAELDLAPTKSIEELILKLESQVHPNHSAPPPQPKTRKRTVAEMAADEALAAEQERFMLIYDERLSSKNGTAAQGAGAGTDADGRGAVTGYEPRFERFNLIAEIKREHAERKEQERLKQIEAQRRLDLQKQQQAEQAQQQALAAQREAAEAQEKARQEMMLRNRQAAARAEAQRRALQAQQNQAAVRAQQEQAQAQVNQANQQAQAQQGQLTNMNQQHAHPMANGMPNGVPSSMAGQAAAQARFQQQVSQAPVSSPLIRQGTPQNAASSPMGVPMQHSTSNMGAGSPARPPSVAQMNAPASAPMAASLSAHGSQQGHPQATPRMVNQSPSMQTPNSRPQVVQTPRMTQASPPPGMNVNVNGMTPQQMANSMLLNQGMGPQMTGQQQLMAQQIAQQQRIRQQQLAALQNQGMNGMAAGMSPQQVGAHNIQQQQLYMQQVLRMQQQQQQRNQMVNAPTQQIAQQYAQQLNNMQMHAGAGGQLPAGATPQQRQMMAAAVQAQQNQNNLMQLNGGMAPNAAQMAALQQHMQQQQAQAAQIANQQAQAQQAQAAAAQGGGGGVPGQPGQRVPIHPQVLQQLMANPMFQQQVERHAQGLFTKNLPMLANKYGGRMENVPKAELENYREQCNMMAKQDVATRMQLNNLQRQRAQAMQQQALQNQAQAQAQGLAGGMANGMGGVAGMNGVTGVNGGMNVNGAMQGMMPQGGM
jgi:transcription factor SPT20